ncbi:MAG: SLBB domain-containing protein [Clostridia bacterium]|nr:SLBB domain-containing protein [Clostridia bacterium]
MNLKDLQGILQENGIVGAGGAGFPTYAKLSKTADTVILNCAECEPLLKLHRQVLETHPQEIFEALDLISKTVNAKRVCVALKKSYHETTEAIAPFIEFFSNIEICHLDDVYPIGDEIILTYEVTGRIVPPGDIPLSVGVMVLNVETVYNLYRAMNGRPVTRKYVTIAGEVENPVTVRVPLGVTVGEILALAGNITTPDPAFIIGGPMMGSLGSKANIVTKTTNAVLVLPREHSLIRRRQSKTFIDMKRAMAACCQCSYCTSLCSRNLLGHPINPSEFMRVASNSITNDAEPYINALYCSGCGLCEQYSCVQNLSPRMLLAACKTELRKAGVKPQAQKDNLAINPNRPLRQVPMARLTSRIGLKKYNKPAPIIEAVPKFKKVTMLLSQHVGAPSVPVVKKGDEVCEKQLIAKAGNGLSVALHSPVNGKVTAIGKTAIIIEKQ